MLVGAFPISSPHWRSSNSLAEKFYRGKVKSPHARRREAECGEAVD
jgi:hypothetical protein